MFKRKINRKSIIFRIGILMTFVVALQALFAVGMIITSGVSKTLEKNAYSLFAEQVQKRNNYLMGEMINRWSNISGFKNSVADKYDEIVIDGQGDADEKTVDFLDASVGIMVEMLKTSMTTGGFIILDDDTGGEGANSGVYIINSNPSLNVTSSSDLQMLRGPSDISKKYKIPLVNSWSYGIKLDDAHRDILEKPIEATKLTDNDRYLGYWHISPSLANASNRVMTYSLPLVDKDGKTFGVMGIEVSQDYLYKVLPFDDFADTGSYGYAIVDVNQDIGEVTPLISQGTVQKSIVPLGEPIMLTIDNSEFKCYSAQTTIGDVSAYYEPINIYSPNTPFEENRWYLMGITAKSNITAFADNLNNMLLMIVFISVGIGFLISCLMGYYFARPIMRLSDDVSSSDAGGIVSLKTTGISEIDELSSAIEKLNKDVLESAIKTDKIMEMANVGIGSFEHKRGSDIVTASTALQKMLNLQPLSKNRFAILADEFYHVVAEIKNHPEEGMDNVYLAGTDPNRWYNITQIENQDGSLGVVIDVTKDVLERYALNYERDYDILTGIFNRLAFRRKSMSIFSKGDLKIAAVAMFDLDNLKYVNDTHGHEVGDIYIKTAAQIMEKVLIKNAVIGRMSGDEFFAFLYDFDTKDEILAYLNEIYFNLDADPIVLNNGAEFKIRMSGGIAWYGEDSVDFDELIRYADFAMYEGKNTVKGELREFEKSVYLSNSFMLSGKEELNRILDNQFIEFVYQPIVWAQTGEIYAYEALMRPQSEILNTPLKLIQIATAQSQLWKIEKITFFKAMSGYMKYRELFNDAKIFINSVPNEILKDHEYQEFERLYGDVLQNIVVEIIENERLDAESLEIKLDKIAEWGAKVALDDYGSGYNSDLNLLNLNPYIVKLDRFLISNVQIDVSRQAIVAKIVGFCKERDILVLAEGVETVEQVEYLVKIGIDFLQGYYVCRPAPVPDFNNEEIVNQIQRAKAIAAEEKTKSGQ